MNFLLIALLLCAGILLSMGLIFCMVVVTEAFERFIEWIDSSDN